MLEHPNFYTGIHQIQENKHYQDNTIEWTISSDDMGKGFELKIIVIIVWSLYLMTRQLPSWPTYQDNIITYCNGQGKGRNEILVSVTNTPFGLKYATVNSTIARESKDK